jgi:hexosaminidase
MINFNFFGDITLLEAGIRILSAEMPFRWADDGIPVKVEQRSGNLQVVIDDDNVIIRYEEKIHFFRALGLLVESLKQQGSRHIEEQPMFSFNGAMFDASRNQVLTTESIKKMMTHMALMGLNGFMLYTEDTFTVESNPYIGYMRGRYSHEEIKECDDYADLFGIEMIPCIQTLAHVGHILKWKNSQDIKDIADIFLVGDPNTYLTIEEMIKSVSSAVRSKRIHIGMDEAHSLGLGKYLKQHGYQSRFEIMTEHLRKVIQITEKYGLKPMIWSDMYFRLGSTTDDYYDRSTVIPEASVLDLPTNVQFVYWDYYHHEEEDYLYYLQKHKQLGMTPIFAGGVWTWNSPSPNFSKTEVTTNAALSACKKENVQEVFATMWGDNGGETNLFASLPGLQLFAEHGYSLVVDESRMNSRFAICTGGDYDAFMRLDQLDTTPFDNYLSVNGSHRPSNPSRYILWQDILIGLFDKYVEGQPLRTYYYELGKRINEDKESNEAFKELFEFYERLCFVLSVKSEIGLALKAAYDSKDRTQLLKLTQESLPSLYESISVLHRTHRELWMKTCKPFGWEIMDIRYGGMMVRIDTAVYRLNAYLNGELNKLDELEEERLYMDGPRNESSTTLGHAGSYNSIVSTSNL